VELDYITVSRLLLAPIGVRGGGSGGAAAVPQGLKNFRANSVFQGKRKLLKTPANKNYIFSTVNLGHPLLFRASESCSKLLNEKSTFNTVKNSRTRCFSGQAQVSQKS